MDISAINSAMTQMQVQAGEAKTGGTFQSALDSAMENKDKTQLRKACVAFESYFIQMMFKEMRKSVDSSGGILPKGQAEKIFEEMLDEEAAKSMAKGRGIGLAEEMYQQMSRQLGLYS
jgi:flagellar protein FlgJ